MFTGIIEETGMIEGIKHGAKSSALTISANKILEGTRLGDSICTNGVCLTVTKLGRNTFQADVMAESLRRTNLGDLKAGDRVNLERALRLSDRLGGHIVSGHVDGTGRIQSFIREDNAVWVTIETKPEILKYIIEKGSITIDGISLTVAAVDDKVFKVSIIPHTGEETTLLKKKAGDRVNLENDLIGKYVEKLLRGDGEEEKPAKKTISEDYLREYGFI